MSEVEIKKKQVRTHIENAKKRLIGRTLREGDIVLVRTPLCTYT